MPTKPAELEKRMGAFTATEECQNAVEADHRAIEEWSRVRLLVRESKAKLRLAMAVVHAEVMKALTDILEENPDFAPDNLMMVVKPSIFHPSEPNLPRFRKAESEIAALRAFYTDAQVVQWLNRLVDNAELNPMNKSAEKQFAGAVPPGATGIWESLELPQPYAGDSVNEAKIKEVDEAFASLEEMVIDPDISRPEKADALFFQQINALLRCTERGGFEKFAEIEGDRINALLEKIAENIPAVKNIDAKTVGNLLQSLKKIKEELVPDTLLPALIPHIDRSKNANDCSGFLTGLLGFRDFSARTAKIPDVFFEAYSQYLDRTIIKVVPYMAVINALIGITGKTSAKARLLAEKLQRLLQQPPDDRNMPSPKTCQALRERLKKYGIAHPQWLKAEIKGAVSV